MIFQNADHSFTLRSGNRVAYQQNGVWLPSKLQVAALNDGSGWTLTGVPINASLVGPTAIVKDLSLTSGSVTMNFHLPQLTYNGDDTFNFQENGTAWLLRVSEGAVTISAKVAKRAGNAAHSLGYNSFGSAVTIDAKGGLHVGGQVHLSRPVMVGADGKSFAACSQWSSNGSAVSFTCDDTKLPDAAFPYVIDPDFTTGPSGYDWPYLEDDEEDCCYSGQNWDDNYWNETFDVSSIPANSITGVNVTGPGSSWYPLLGYGATPSCQSNGSSWSIANGVLTYTMDFQMGWYADGSWYACEGTIYNPGSATADITYTAPETYVVPNMTGPLSANTGIPMTINIPGGQQYSSWGKPEFFVFYYGDSTGSGYVYTSTTHTYSAPGTYQMTFNVYTTNGPYVPAANAWTVTVTTLPVSITLATSPPGLTITADGTGYISPHVFSWMPGSQHTIAVSSPQGSSGTQYVFSSWTDAGAASHTITVPTSAATYTANFVTQYYLTTAPGANGSITPASGWQNAGNVQITAVPSPDYALNGFGGALSGTTNPQTLNLTGPATVTASFLAVPTSSIYTSPPGLQISVDGGGAVSCNPCDYQWLTNSWHSVSAALQSGGAGVQYAFLNWSDGLGASHSFEVPSQGTNLTATFQPQYYLTTSVSPAGSGAIMVGAPTQWGPVVATGTQAAGWYNAGSPFWIIAQASAGYQFSSLSPVDNLWEQIALHQPMTVTATFVPFYGQTVTSNPPGASITVDGASCTTPCTYQWSTGTQHTLSVASPQYPASGTQLIFSSWTDDSSGSSDTIIAAVGAVYVANFGTQYYLTTSAVPPAGGSISPGSGWYNSGQVVQVSATPNVGYPFTGFSGGLTGTTNPQNVTMNTPVTVTADFGATAAISSSPSTLSFTVDGSACVGGVCPFTPQPSGDTLAASPVSPPTSGPSASYQFTGSGLASQAIAAPPPGASGDGCHKWKCTGGSCTVNTPTGSPQPAPIIQPPPGGTYAISSDPAGLSPAVIYAGVTTTIYINGTNFGDVAGWATFCGAQSGACNYGELLSSTQSCPGQCTWTNNQITMVVAIDPADQQADSGLWWLYLNVPFWISGAAAENPSTGSFEMELATSIAMGGTVIASSAEQIGCATCSVVVGQQIVLSGYPVIGGYWSIQGPIYSQWYGTGAPPNPVPTASADVLFYWAPDGRNDPTNDYTVSYTVNGVAATATFTVGAPTVTGEPQGGTHVNTGLDQGALTSSANMTVVAPPPAGFNGAAWWIQVIPSAAYLFTSQGGGTLAACTPPPPGPPWLDGQVPYPIPYPGNLGPNQYGFYDSPSVSLATAQQDGAAGVTRQVRFAVYLMWQPQIAGTSFPVPLLTTPWGFSDWASLADGVWTAGGAITQALAPVLTNAYPTWSGVAQLNAPPVCTAITIQ